MLSRSTRKTFHHVFKVFLATSVLPLIILTYFTKEGITGWKFDAKQAKESSENARVKIDNMPPTIRNSYDKHERLNSSEDSEPTPIMRLRSLMNKQYDEKKIRKQLIKYWPEDASMFSKDETKKILFYNEFRGRNDFYFGEGSDPFVKAGCPVANCFATYNRSLLNPLAADAIVWHQLGSPGEIPKEKSPHTRMVYYIMEAPNRLPRSLPPKFKNFFNYTMSYSDSSDIYDPYGVIVKRVQPLKIDPNKNLASGKNKMAAWFVSNCKAKSKRERIVNKIQKYFDVDIYGRCGRFKCPKTKINQSPDDCMEKIEKDYKFYFSFENSLCKDYISEKFFNAARFNIVPVVYGLGPYEEVAPDRSYINVLDFKNVKELAEYLLYLSKNDTAYNEYLAWKSEYQSFSNYRQEKTPEYKNVSWCKLCQKLHTDHQPQVYSEIEHFHSHEQCINPDNQIMKQFLEQI